MSTISLEAEARTDIGKGASRRLRRLENKIPAVLYGGEKQPESIHLSQNKVLKALEMESIYSSVFDLHYNGKVEKVILKDMQRHPYKTLILHMDFQRVSAKDVLIRMVPLHFINEEEAPGVKEGGIVNHTMTQVEIRCQAQHLPEFISVDLSQMNLDDVLHMTNLQLPKGVSFALDPKEGGHDHPVVGIHLSRASLVEEEVDAVEGEEAELSEASASESDDASEENNAE
jgi:large subunit ribosomal protein L25